MKFYIDTEVLEFFSVPNTAYSLQKKLGGAYSNAHAIGKRYEKLGLLKGSFVQTKKGMPKKEYILSEKGRILLSLFVPNKKRGEP